jgi:hypothetical protein
VVGAVFIIISFIIFVIGLLGDLIAINRRLNEETLYYIKKLALTDKPLPSNDSRDELTYEQPHDEIVSIT